jgi:YidC/Oxa1 family membrane protein insertase
MENKQTLIAILLMLVVWMGFSILFPPQPQQENEVAQQQEVSQSSSGETPAASITPVDPTVSGNVGLPLKSSVDKGVFVVDTPRVRLTLAQDSGRVLRTELKNYRQSLKDTAGAVVLVDTLQRGVGTLGLGGTDGFRALEGLSWSRQDRGDLRLSEGEQRSLVFTAKTAEGLDLVKTLEIDADHYQINVTLRVANQGSAPLSGNLVFSHVQPWSDDMEGSMYEFVGPTTLTEEKKYQDKVKDLRKEEKKYSAPIYWTGFEKKYFLTALIPVDDTISEAQVRYLSDMVVTSLFTGYQTLSPGDVREFSFKTYMGPKDFDLLSAAGHRLSDAVDYGFFGFLARPLLHVLKFFYGFLHNYGLAIILLTVIIKLIFWPLTQKSYTSMKGMQKLQPHMQKLREKYKDDKQRLNVELMNLYKEHRVNPLGGCLPMLVQIPVFFALYKTLLISIELRHAPFFLWIADLSAKDPYYVTPLLMGASMFVQQKLTPSTMDPMQARLFLAMPIVFTVLFLNFPAGLVLYWLTNNLLTIGQQYLIHRQKD